MICLSSESYDDTVWLLRQTSKDINNIAMHNVYSYIVLALTMYT